MAILSFAERSLSHRLVRLSEPTTAGGSCKEDEGKAPRAPSAFGQFATTLLTGLWGPGDYRSLKQQYFCICIL
jgi:hypothetical protein